MRKNTFNNTVSDFFGEYSIDSLISLYNKNLDCLTNRQREVFELKFKDGEERDTKEVAEMVGLTYTRIRQILATTFRKLKKSELDKRYNDGEFISKLNFPITTICSSNRVCNSLLRNNIRTIQDLLDFMKENKLTSLESIGKTVEESILDALCRIGIDQNLIEKYNSEIAKHRLNFSLYLIVSKDNSIYHLPIPDDIDDKKSYIYNNIKIDGEILLYKRVEIDNFDLIVREIK